MSPEEGRFPRFRLYVPARTGTPLARIVELSVELPKDASGVSALKRLAPAADSLKHTLVLAEGPEAWICTGLASLMPHYFSNTLGAKEWHLLQPHRPQGITIRVDGPGSIRVGIDAFTTIKLRAGALTTGVPIIYAKPVQDLAHAIGSAITDGWDIPRFAMADGGLAQHAIPVHHIVDHIAARMSAGGYGGALIFPGAFDEAVISEGQYRVEAQELSIAMRDFYTASVACTAVSGLDELRTALAKWQHAQASIFRTADAVAMMSRVDGCVVLDKHFNVRSFGSKIMVNADGAGPKLPPQRSEDEAEIRALGTRNQSAFGLCRSILNSTAIVVSQDGDIRVFGSTSDSVSFFSGLEASSLDLPTW